LLRNRALGLARNRPFEGFFSPRCTPPSTRDRPPSRVKKNIPAVESKVVRQRRTRDAALCSCPPAMSPERYRSATPHHQHRRRPTPHTSNMLLSAVTNLGGLLAPSCPHRGTTGPGWRN